MLTKWFLAAALFSGLTASALLRADGPAKPAAQDSVKVEIRGTLHVLGLENAYPVEGRCLPPPRTYEIEIDGKKFQLLMGRFAAEADKLDGCDVFVTGTLDLDTVKVTGLTGPLEAFGCDFTEFVRVTVLGDLREIPVEFPPYDRELWTVKAGNQTFFLSFADSDVAARASANSGRKVILTGELKGGRILVRSVRPAVPVSQLEPAIDPFKLPSR